MTGRGPSTAPSWAPPSSSAEGPRIADRAPPRVRRPRPSLDRQPEAGDSHGEAEPDGSGFVHEHPREPDDEPGGDQEDQPTVHLRAPLRLRSRKSYPSDILSPAPAETRDQRREGGVPDGHQPRRAPQGTR